MSVDVNAVLGIAVEPLSVIEGQLAILPPAIVRDPLADTSLLAERIVKHLVNYLSGFATASGTSLGPESYVQLGVVTRWYESFMSKLRAGGIGFLERLEQ